MNRRDAIKAVMAMPGVTAIAVATVAPEDVIVLEHPGLLSQEAVANIRATVQRVWPGQRVIVLEEGMTMQIQRAAAVGAR